MSKRPEADGLSRDHQELGDLRTEAAERNNVAKTTILHACSVDSDPGSETRSLELPTPGAFRARHFDLWHLPFNLCLALRARPSSLCPFLPSRLPSLPAPVRC